jgi:glutamate racemase
VFDSGVGGLSVLKEISRTLPSESIYYFGDTVHVPYGGRPLPEVRGYALNICRFLVAQGVKAIVMACNISSAIAIGDARSEFPDIPIIGVIEPGSAAAIVTGSNRIGVLATQGTVSSGAYTRTITYLSPQSEVVEVACPKFVPLVEAEEVETSEAYTASIDYLSPLADARSSAIILGCTHYPFLESTLTAVAKKLFPPDDQPSFIDPAIATTVKLAGILANRALLAAPNKRGHHIYFVSGSPSQFQKNGSFFLGRPIVDTKKVLLD